MKDNKKLLKLFEESGISLTDEQKENMNKKLDEKNDEPKKQEIPEDVKQAMKQADGIFKDIDETEKSEGEDIKEIISTWLDDLFIHAKTRLTPNQVIALTILKTLATEYNIECINKLLDNFVRYKLSENGQSSKELVDILKARNQIEPDDDLSKQIEPFLR